MINPMAEQRKQNMSAVNVENSEVEKIEVSGSFMTSAETATVAKEINDYRGVHTINQKITINQSTNSPQKVGWPVQKSGMGSTKRNADAVQAAGTSGIQMKYLKKSDTYFGAKNLNLSQGLESQQKPNNTIIVFDKTSKHLQSYDPEKNSWKQIQTMNEDMVKDVFTAVVLHPHIYALLRNKAFYRVDYTKLNSERNATWERMADIKLGWEVSVAVLNGFIYAAEYIDSSSVEKYDPANNKWVAVVKKNKECSGATLVSARGNLYCIGGYDGFRRSLRDVEKFDPITSTWSYAQPMNEARSYVAAVEVDDKIYVMGGWDDLSADRNSVECYDIDLNSWTNVVNMKMPRSCLSACVIGRKIFVVGGDERFPRTVEMLDEERKEWKIVERLEGMDIEHFASVAVMLDPQ